MKWLTPQASRLWTNHLPLRSPMARRENKREPMTDHYGYPPTSIVRMPLAMPRASFAGITVQVLRPACRRRRLSPLSSRVYGRTLQLDAGRILTSNRHAPEAPLVVGNQKKASSASRACSPSEASSWRSTPVSRCQRRTGNPRWSTSSRTR